ncbi:hypothetical protein CL634_08725 [bacterium]|nr:hypothetical protein [bacterium]|tara:strand:+ start:611 stop:1054 length:444 start_codon:yes stop_codon:yes gene_type:complete
MDMHNRQYFTELDFTEQIKGAKADDNNDAKCPQCHCLPCICGSRQDTPETEAKDQHKNLEKLAEKIVPLVDEINEELARHASVCKKRTWADKDAGYPPNCKKGFVEKDGKCVPAPKEKDEATHDGRKKGYHGPASYSDLWKKVNKKN